MKIDKKEIKARIKGSELRNGVIKRFAIMDNLPKAGDPVVGTRYVYGDGETAELAGWQHTRDQEYHHLYDFYTVPVLNDGFIKIGDAYICTPHRSKKDITPKIYTSFIALAQKCDTFEEFMDKAMASELWAHEDVDKNNREEWLKQLYVAARRTVPEIIKEAHLTQMKLANYFGIPRRTVEGWIYENIPPVYTIMMIQEILGLVKRK